MFKIYGSKMCPDCVNVKFNFDRYGIEYEFIDINESLRDLKAFLALRDSLPVFDHSKEVGDIGIPALVGENGEVFLSWDTYLEDRGLEVVYPGEDMAGEACSIDGKGC
jgi:glutaredoxin-related protein